jgi:hypothetical protein
MRVTPRRHEISGGCRSSWQMLTSSLWAPSRRPDFSNELHHPRPPERAWARTTPQVARDQTLISLEGQWGLGQRVRPPGFEPGTCGLRVRCSAIELEARRRSVGHLPGGSGRVYDAIGVTEGT